MLTRLKIRNFKRFEDADIELGKAVVFVGPNNSGKTTALQALTLWNVGLQQWNSKRTGEESPQERPGITINRKDLVSIPVPVADMLWNGSHIRRAQKTEGKNRTLNIRIDIVVEGITNSQKWSCGLEFDCTNDQSLVCRPLRQDGFDDVPIRDVKFTKIPDDAGKVKVAFLPPMSGLSDREFIKQQDEIDVCIGQGQTAQILRNLCYKVSSRDSTAWGEIVEQIQTLFGVRLLDPKYAGHDGIIIKYEENEIQLDLSCGGRGLQQTLLLLTYLYANPDTILLLDEPDAHLEILRQRQIFGLITETAERLGSQVIVASHSEVILNEAAGKGKVVAFLGRPHAINDKGSQLLKSLQSIGWDQYYQAEEMGWILYVENVTDLSILQTFARLLPHQQAMDVLQRPFVRYVATNIPQKARDHFFGLREAKTDLQAIAIFDRIDSPLQSTNGLTETMWKRREIENYLCMPEVLIAYAKHDQPDDLFGIAEVDRRIRAMQESIEDVSKLLEIDGNEIWSPDVKASDEVLDRIFRVFFKKLDLPLIFRKSDYYVLANYVPKEKIDSEISEKLDMIVQIAQCAKPKRNISVSKTTRKKATKG